MIYMGSKAKIADYIVPIIQSHITINHIKTYIEPFCGGCNVIDKIQAQNRIAADKNEYLISLFKYLQSGGQLPDMVSKEEYDKVRVNKEKFPAWYVGAVGFLASFKGRFFEGGYSGISGSRNYYKEARDNILKQITRGSITGIDFMVKDYREFCPTNCVIYCDPPYSRTTQYTNSKDFDHAEFWQVVRDWSRSNIVFISELTAPKDFITIWQKDINRSITTKERFKATEKLFVYDGVIKDRK